MITYPTIEENEGNYYKQITHPNKYWGVAYNNNLLVKVYTTEDNPLSANSFVFASAEWDGFASDSFEEFQNKVIEERLVFPPIE